MDLFQPGCCDLPYCVAKVLKAQNWHHIHPKSWVNMFFQLRNDIILPCQVFTLHCPAVAFPDWLWATAVGQKKTSPISLLGNCGAFTIKILII